VAVGKVYVKGQVVDIISQSLLWYTTFDPDSELEDIPFDYLTVTYELIPTDKSLRLKVSQGDFAVAANGEKRYADTVAGWDMVLPRIKTIAEGLGKE
jgi:hypothetical protein